MPNATALNLYVELSKVDDEKRLVYGYASTEKLDSQKERVAKDAIEKALPEYMRFANIREMHQPSAVGVAQEAIMDDKGLYLVAKVVDDAAWLKVKEGVYKGFSIGGRRLSKTGDIVTGLELTEISLVDRPANPEAVIELWKCDMPTEKTVVAEAEVVAPAVVEAVAAAPAEVKKSLYDVAALAQMIQGMAYICSCVEDEAEMEADNSGVPEACRAALRSMAQAFKDMAAEEVDEVVAAVEPEVEPAEEMQMAAKTDDLAKAVSVAVQQKDSEIDELKKRIAELEKLPATVGTTLTIVEKIHDGQAFADQQQLDAERLSKMSPDDRARELIKMAHGAPKVFGSVPTGLR